MSAITNTQDSFVNVSVAGSGYIVLPHIYPTLESAAFAGGPYVANTVYGLQINVPWQITITTFNAWIKTAVAATHAGFGLYDTSGNKLVSGIVSGAATGKASVTVGSVVITAGVYNYCWTVDSATLGVSVGGLVDNVCLGLLAAASRGFTAANVGVAGALPATLGTRSNLDLSGVSGPPFCICTP